MSFWFFLILTICCIICEAFFAMMEMASISFNRIRLHYYENKKNKKAQFLKKLLENPTYLFGTCLIGVTLFLQLGSEASRQLYASLGLNPDLSPLTQIVVVLIFAELVPLFVARKYPEKITFFGIKILYFCFKFLFPILWVIEKMANFIGHIFHKEEISLFVSREELQKAFEEKVKQKDPIGSIINHLFSLKTITASELMVSLEEFPEIYSSCEIKDLPKKLPIFFPIYFEKNLEQLIGKNFTKEFDKNLEEPKYKIKKVEGIVYLRDLLSESNKDSTKNKKISELAKKPWLTSEKSNILHILKNLKKNNQEMAIVVDDYGVAKGILTLDQIISSVFKEMPKKEENFLMVEKTISGDMLVKTFNKKFNANLPYDSKSVSDLISLVLGHMPVENEIIQIGNFEIVVTEPSLLGAKTVIVKTII